MSESLEKGAPSEASKVPVKETPEAVKPATQQLEGVELDDIELIETKAFA